MYYSTVAFINRIFIMVITSWTTLWISELHRLSPPIISDCLIGLGISVSDFWPWGHGFDSQHFQNFNSELGPEQGPPNLMRKIRYLLDWEVADMIRKVDLLHLKEHNANHITPSYCYLPVGCRSLVDRCGSLGSCKPHI